MTETGDGKGPSGGPRRRLVATEGALADGGDAADSLQTEESLTSSDSEPNDDPGRATSPLDVGAADRSRAVWLRHSGAFRPLVSSPEVDTHRRREHQGPTIVSGTIRLAAHQRPDWEPARPLTEMIDQAQRSGRQPPEDVQCRRATQEDREVLVVELSRDPPGEGTVVASPRARGFRAAVGPLHQPGGPWPAPWEGLPPSHGHRPHEAPTEYRVPPPSVGQTPPGGRVAWFPFPPPQTSETSLRRTACSPAVTRLLGDVRSPVSDALPTETLVTEGIGSLSEPSAKGWLSHRRQVEALYRTRRWPLGRAKSLLKSSLSQAAAEVAIGVDFSLEDEEVPLDVVLDRLQARFLSGTNSVPAINEFLDAHQMSLEPLPNWFTRLKVLYRRAFPQLGSDPGLYSSLLAVQFKKGLEDPHLRDHMLRHECSEINEALHIAISAQRGLEASLRLSRGPQPLAPGHCPTCGLRRPRLGPSPPLTHCVCGRDF